MDNDYFEWLCHKVCLERNVDYTLLITKLHKTPYDILSNIQEDRNRIKKTLELRNYFTSTYDIQTTTRPVSVLEVLVSVAMDIEDKIMRDSDAGDRTAVWFWQMINNLGLLKYTDDNFDTRAVNDVLYRFIHRKYDRNGVGSIGFTKEKDCDFRDMDIWQQFNVYLTEKYF